MSNDSFIRRLSLVIALSLQTEKNFREQTEKEEERLRVQREKEAIEKENAEFRSCLQKLLQRHPDALRNKMENPTTMPEGSLRVMLWAPPRSLSTAFERCIASSRNDVEIYHEMFTAAYHIGPERQAKIPMPVASNMVTEDHFTYDWVQTELEKPRSENIRVVFCKELGYTMKGHFRNLPSGYKHTFLIRHPAKVFISMQKLLDKFLTKYVLNIELMDILPEGLVFRELYELFCYIKNTLGQSPVIIDADDLIQYPERTLRAYCRAVGLQFSPTMMNWNPLEEEKDRWNYSTRLMFINRVIGQYDRAFSTSKLHKGDERPLDLSAITPEVLNATGESVKYYEELYKLRLRPICASADMVNKEYNQSTSRDGSEGYGSAESTEEEDFDKPMDGFIDKDILIKTSSHESRTKESPSRRAVLKKLVGEV